MVATSARIKSVSRIYGLQAAVFQTEKVLHTEPGQYLAMLTGEVDTPVPFTAFVIDQDKNTIQVAPVPADWLPGKEIQVRGGLGKGFHIPSDANKLALVSLDEHPIRLLYQLTAASRKNLEILLVCDHFNDHEVASHLPLAVEVLPMSDLPEAIRWADMVDLDCPRNTLDKLGTFQTILLEKSRKSMVEVLISTEMPCLGIAECGVCAVQTRKGYQLACKDGPVFRYQDLVL